MKASHYFDFSSVGLWQRVGLLFWHIMFCPPSFFQGFVQFDLSSDGQKYNMTKAKTKRWSQHLNLLLNKMEAHLLNSNMSSRFLMSAILHFRDWILHIYTKCQTHNQCSNPMTKYQNSRRFKNSWIVELGLRKSLLDL